MMITFYSLFFFLTGTILGSFFNVVGYRMPKKESIAFPPSHCPNCNKKLGVLELIPIISYIFLGGKCKGCKSEISIMYPFVELLTGLLFFLSYIVFGLSIELLLSLVFVSLTVIVIVSDIRYMIIPDEIIVVFLILSVVSRLILNGFSDFSVILLDSIIPFITLFLIKELGDFIFKKETLGGGDIKLMLIVGTIIGWDRAIMTVFLGSLLAFPVALIYLVRKKEHMLPFGPYICVAALLIHYAGLSSMEIIRLFYH